MGLFDKSSKTNGKQSASSFTPEMNPPPPSYDDHGADAGPSGSQPEPAYTPSTRHASVILASSDKIRIVGFPDETIPVITTAIRSSWDAEAQEPSKYDAVSYEWKLRGLPYKSTLGPIPSPLQIPSIRYIVFNCLRCADSI